MKKIIAVLFLTLPLLAHAADSYVCITDQGTGFSKENGQWVQTNFTPEKYLIRPPKDGETTAPNSYFSESDFLLFEIGFEPPWANCKDQYPLVMCVTEHRHFTLHIKSLKFTSFTRGLYHSGNSDTPVVEIGTCSKL